MHIEIILQWMGWELNEKSEAVGVYAKKCNVAHSALYIAKLDIAGT